LDKVENLSALTKDEALETLNRTIGFVNNCDSKSSVILGIFGVMITILFSGEGINGLKFIIKSAITEGTTCGAFYFILLFIAFATLGYGNYKLLMVLFANTNCGDKNQDGLESDSKIFFGSISKNVNFKQYKEKLYTYSEEDYLNDIISQIYINSIICNEKFENYKRGMKISIIGFLAFVFIWGLGIIVY
jgi:hypothetical protein